MPAGSLDGWSGTRTDIRFRRGSVTSVAGSADANRTWWVDKIVIHHYLGVHEPDRSADDRRRATRERARGGPDRVRRARPGRHLDRARRAPGRDQPAVPVPPVPDQEGALRRP